MLAGVRILDLTRFPPGAYGTTLLAGLGADVCRVQSASGGGATLSVALGRDKRSVAVDLRHERGTEVLQRLASWADVIVEAERPGAMEERGFGYTTASQELPALIWCSISGFGQDGPYSESSGHDLSYVAHSGLLAAVQPDLPWYPQTILAIPAASTIAAVGILAALRERDRTGRGCQLDVSMSEAATWFLSGDDGELNGRARRIPGGPDRHLYRCADGRWVALASAEPRTWDALCAALALTDLIGTVHRWDDPDEVIERLAAVFASRRADEWIADLVPLGVAIVRVNSGAELQRDPHIEQRQTLENVAGVMVPRHPIRVRDASGERPRPAPRPPAVPGADTAAVLLEAGFSNEEIASLLDQEVVSRP